VRESRRTGAKRYKEEVLDTQRETPYQETPEPPTNQPFEGQVHEIASLFPKIDDPFHLTPEIMDAIGTAIHRHGRAAVWAGTKGMADQVAGWPISELQFIPSAKRYFGESQYLKDPRCWNRKPRQAHHERAIQEANDVRKQTHDLLRRQQQQADQAGVDRRPPTRDIPEDGQTGSAALGGAAQYRSRCLLGSGG
jgi:hypothetical protein